MSDTEYEYWKCTKSTRVAKGWELRENVIYSLEKGDPHKTLKYFRNMGCEFEKSTKDKHDKQELMRALR